MFALSLHIHLKRTSMCGINVVGGGGVGLGVDINRLVVWLSIGILLTLRVKV